MKGNRCVHIAILVIAFISLFESAISGKFDFPKYLIGTNHSDEYELKPYQMLYKPVDLGIDLFDDDAPIEMQKALVRAAMSDDPMVNQYGPKPGLVRLREAIAKLYTKLINHELNPETDVLVTAGATGGVYNAFMGHTSPGDEWIIIEPAYTMYLPMIQMARGVPRFTTLKLAKKSGKITGDDWILDRKEMESLFNNRTKGILLNNPLNPLGKVYTYSELQFIASMAKKYNTLVISDEAHEFITFKPHIRIASLPGMFERTITIGSASKSFSVSGWRIGWAYGPANILNNLKAIGARTIDGASTPNQDAVAYGFEQELANLGKPDSYFVSHLETVRQRRDFMVKAFIEAGMSPIVPDGGYCMLTKWSSLPNLPVEQAPGSAMNFAKWSIKNIGILGLPLTGFYSKNNKHLGEDYLRYCFHKKEETVRNAAKNLKKLKVLA